MRVVKFISYGLLLGSIISVYAPNLYAAFLESSQPSLESERGVTQIHKHHKRPSPKKEGQVPRLSSCNSPMAWVG